MNADDNLLDYPFDQYQRYQDVRLVVDTIQSRHQAELLTILDVGGSPLTKRFLSSYAVVSVNLEAGSGVQAQCDGTRLPFADGRFDIVVTVDTLEHVPEALRAVFIRELLRVSSDYAIITGPFANDYNEAAEAALNEFLVNVIGMQHRFLTEHLQNGLPDLDTCLRTVTEICKGHVTIPSGYIHHWLPLMIIKHGLMRIAGGQDIVDELDRFYNYACYWSDHRLPCYRWVVVASRSGDAATLTSVQQAFDPPEQSPTPDLNGVVAMWQVLRWQQVLKERNEQIDRLQTENRRLNELVSAYASGRFMRFMAALKLLIGLARRK